MTAGSEFPTAADYSWCGYGRWHRLKSAPEPRKTHDESAASDDHFITGIAIRCSMCTTGSSFIPKYLQDVRLQQRRVLSAEVTNRWPS